MKIKKQAANAKKQVVTSQSEYAIQKEFCTIARQLNLFFFSVPNERKSSAIAMNKLKAIGLRAGIPDIVILAKSTCYFLEFKKPGGKRSQNQKKIHDQLKKLDYKVATVYSVTDAIEKLKSWQVVK